MDQKQSMTHADGAARKRRVFVVDDHPITRLGFASIINAESDLEVCGETDTAICALELIERLKPDAALIDITLSDTSGIELMKNLKAVVPEVALLAVTMHDQILYAERALRAGARGYLMKQDASEYIILALRSILSDELYLSEAIRELMLDRFTLKKDTNETVSRVESLSDREMEIFNLLGEGFTTRQIAAALKLSGKTIDSHRENLKLKLQVNSAAELVHRAVQWSKQESTMEKSSADTQS